MAFRDDSEALRQRVEMLEQELGEAREALQEAQRALAEKDREIEDVRTGRDREKRRAKWAQRRGAFGEMVRAARTWIYVAVGVGVAAGMFVLLTGPDSEVEYTTVRGLTSGDAQQTGPFQPEAPSSPSPSPALAPGRPPQRLAGHVAETTGIAPVTTGDSCEVLGVPIGTVGAATTSCRVFVSCEGTELFAVDVGHGYAACDLFFAQSRSEVDVRTDDGDPRLTIDRPSREVVVANDDWRVRITIGGAEVDEPRPPADPASPR